MRSALFSLLNVREAVCADKAPFQVSDLRGPTGFEQSGAVFCWAAAADAIVANSVRTG